MKKLIKILRAAIIIFAIVFALTFVFVLSQGKALIAKQLENALHRQVNIGYAGLSLPFNLEIKNLDIPGLAKLEHISVSPSIPGLLSGNIVLNDLKLINPQLVYEKSSAQAAESPAANVTLPAGAPVTQSKPIPKSISQPKTGGPKESKYLRLIIKNLDIKNGRIDFTDLTVPGNGIKITLKEINFRLTDLYIYPRSAVTHFELTGRIPWLQGEEEGKIEAKGWADLFKKDMQATVKINDIDGVYLYPYYAQWVDLEKTRIQSAKLNFTSNIKSADNNLAAECRIELNDIVFKQREEEEMSKAEKIASAVLDIFKALNKGKVVFNFTIKTRMTNPEFNIGYIKTAFEERLREGMKYSKVDYSQILKVPAKRVGRTATDLSRALYNGTFGLAKLFKDTIKSVFGKEAELE